MTTEAKTEKPEKGIESLKAAVQRDKEKGSMHDVDKKYEWIIDRAKHYAGKLGVGYKEVLKVWEEGRSYWYMNYYQECNQPKIEEDKVRVFDTQEDLLASVGDKGFRCPSCEDVSKSPYKCTHEECDWKVGGLFGHMGKGISVTTKDTLQINKIFMPVEWENEKEE